MRRQPPTSAYAVVQLYYVWPWPEKNCREEMKICDRIREKPHCGTTVLSLHVHYLAKFGAQILKQSGYVRVVCDEWICCNRIHPMCVPKCVEAKKQLKSIRFACWKLEQFTYIFESSEDMK